MNLFKTSFWSGVLSLFKILAGMIAVKIMAIYIGPSGVALLGNYTNITGILSSFSNGAISNGITKYISEYDTNKEKQEVVTLAVKVTVICSVMIGIVIVFMNKLLAKLSFGDTYYSSVFILFGLTMIFFGLNTTVSSILNGYRQIKYLIISGMIGSIISVILAVVITIQFGLLGAIINSIIAQILIFILNVFFIKRLHLFKFDFLFSSVNKTILWKLLKYSLMSIISAIVIPMSTLIIRKYVYNNFSPDEAGYLQGTWSISNSYLTVVTTALSIYYLPTLSSIKENIELRKEIIKGYKFLLPLAIIGGLLIYFFRNLIIYILYSPEFISMNYYLTYQVIGDTLKIASWILAYLMVAKAMTKWFIATEIIFSLLYVVFSYIFMNFYGSIGVTYGYILNYFLYLIFMLILFRKLLFHKERRLNIDENNA